MKKKRALHATCACMPETSCEKYSPDDLQAEALYPIRVVCLHRVLWRQNAARAMAVDLLRSGTSIFRSRNAYYDAKHSEAAERPRKLGY